MHLLENPLEFYPGVADAIGGELQSRRLYCYPDPAYPELRGIIAERHGSDYGQVALGAGSTELIDRVLRTFCAAGDQIIVSKPTWSFFMAFFRRWSLQPVQVPHLGSLKEKNLRHDLDGILAAVTWRTRLIYLVNPCNPTGAAADPEALKEFLQKVPAHVTVMLDEAYFDYSDVDQRLDVSRMLEEVSARVIGLRTFSKFFALSGLRIGYAYANTETIGLLERSGVPFNVASVSQLAARAALRDTEQQHQVYQCNIAERRRISAELDRLNIEHLPTQTNFILFDCPLDQDRFREILLGKGLVLPNVQQFLQNYAVIAVGLPEHNQLVLDTLAQY
jgi:histidinol-phosphate aminotransferase